MKKKNKLVLFLIAISTLLFIITSINIQGNNSNFFFFFL